MFSRRPFHVVLLPLFPILFLWAENAGETSPGDVIPSLAIVVVLALGSLGLLARVTGRVPFAAVAVSSFWGLFFGYGFVVRVLRRLDISIGVGSFGSDLVLLAGMVILWGVVLYRVWHMGRKTSKVTLLLNAVGSVLVVVQLAGIVPAQLSALSSSEFATVTGGVAISNADDPDIYYIVLDGYGRSDVLRDIYGFDNTPMLDSLRRLGFYVADSSFANYAQTLLSLGSTLNLEYLDRLEDFWEHETDRQRMKRLLHRNQVLQRLRSRGYALVSFATGSSYTEFPDVDFRLDPGDKLAEFETMLLSLTPLPMMAPGKSDPYDVHRRRILFTLDRLSETVNMESPKFVFAHVLAPHPPFVLTAGGDPVAPERPFVLADGNHFVHHGGSVREYVRGYRGQVEYVSRRLLEIVTDILGSSRRPPVIIVQGDHGPGSRLNWNLAALTDVRERFGILNAYFLPDDSGRGLYPSITPVNSFRVVFDRYFGEENGNLPDSAYFSSMAYPFSLEKVTSRLR